MLSDGDDPVLEALWARAASEPASEESNRAFVEHCRRAGQLPVAAHRYRAALAGADEATRTRLEARLASVTAAALADLEAKRGEVEPARRPAWITVVAALVLLVALYGLAAAFTAR